MAKTIFNQKLSDGTTVKCRSVYHRELGCDVLVTTEEEYNAHAIEEDSEDDRMFYCYPPEEDFTSIEDEDFENYINENYN